MVYRLDVGVLSRCLCIDWMWFYKGMCMYRVDDGA